jgi:hypothetical protein
MGSTTACVACLDTKGDVNVLNVGDSGFTLLSLGGNGEFSAIGRSVPKDHGPQYRFAPLQLGDYSEDKVCRTIRAFCGRVPLLERF